MIGQATAGWVGGPPRATTSQAGCGRQSTASCTRILRQQSRPGPEESVPAFPNPRWFFSVPILDPEYCDWRSSKREYIHRCSTDSLHWLTRGFESAICTWSRCHRVRHMTVKLLQRLDRESDNVTLCNAKLNQLAFRLVARTIKHLDHWTSYANGPYNGNAG